MTKLQKLATPRNLTERAHLSIKQYILEGHLDTESRLTEDFFAKHLGISKSPVREALNTLQGEGLLRIEPRRGAYLRHFTAKEIKDLYDLREVLEVFAAGSIQITPKLVEELEASVERTRIYLEQDQKALYIEEDIRFHEMIVTATGNQELCRVFANIQDQLWLCRCQTYNLTSPDTPDSHHEISQAIREHDRQRAQTVMRRHISLVREALLQSVTTQLSESTAVPA